MILTDGLHLVSTASIDELHRFAYGIGLRRGWFQNHRYPHYDMLRPAIKVRAMRAGAQWTTTRDLIRAMRRLREGA